MVKPKSASYVRLGGPFEEITTNQADYRHVKSEPVRPFRPSSVLFYHRTDEPLDSMTTHRKDYVAFQVGAPVIARPLSSRYLIDPSRPFDATSTYQEGYTRKLAELRQPIRSRHADLGAPTAYLPFDAHSTHQTDFRGYRGDMRPCPAILVLTKRLAYTSYFGYKL